MTGVQTCALPISSVGSITIGLIHAAHMLIPNARLTFTLPVWLVMTHAMAIATAVHMFEDKRPRLTTKGIVAIAIGWLFWSLLIVGAGWVRHGLWPDDVPWWSLAWPALAVAGFIVVARWKTTVVSAPAAAKSWAACVPSVFIIARARFRHRRMCWNCWDNTARN